MQFKIISDGKPINTRVEDAKTGKLVGLVQKVTWEADINEPLTKCTIEILGVPIALTDVTLNEVKYVNALPKPDNSNFYIRKIYDIITKKDRTSENKTPEEIAKEEAEFMAIVEKVRAEAELTKDETTPSTQE